MDSAVDSARIVVLIDDAYAESEIATRPLPIGNLAHEIGHWLGLAHPYSNSCGEGDADGIADTPVMLQRNADGTPLGAAGGGIAKTKVACDGTRFPTTNIMDAPSTRTAFTNGQRACMIHTFQTVQRPFYRWSAD